LTSKSCHLFTNLSHAKKVLSGFGAAALKEIMNRVIPIVIIVALLLMGGIWLSRQSNTPIQAQQTQQDPQDSEETNTEESTPEDSEEPTPEGTTEETTTENSDQTTSEESTPESAATETSDAVVETTPVVIPEGFTLTPFLSDTKKQNFEKAEDVLEPNKDYQALIKTNKGTIRVDLFETEVPKAVNNFVFLARNHYYDGIIFHRVLEGFMAQTGDPTGTGSGGPGYEFEDEFVDSLKHEKRGTLSMANSGPATNGSQFFITFDATPWLDGKHTIFGTILEGDDVLSKLQLIDPSQPGNPNVIALLDETLADLEAKNVKLAGEPTATVGDYLTSKLTKLPEVGSEFEVDGFKGIAGRMGETLAFGFYLPSDVMQEVLIIEKLKN
jgi:cyclophilin family peptidyl-prolyl cis-trans isomerase